ncbi:MAG: hypothetical protein ACE5I3_06965, partial [Phycisphaerae bacterium]
PDASNDLRGVDAAEKLLVLLRQLGVRRLDRSTLEITGIEQLCATDLAQARALGGTIKPIAHAALLPGRIEGYVGPVFVPKAHPLARIEREENALQLRSRLGGLLSFSGPGAGPDVTAATILDDVAEIVTQPVRYTALRDTQESVAPAACEAPETPWFVRLTFSKHVPPAHELCEFLGAHGVWFQRSAKAESVENGPVQYGLTHASPRLRIELALSALRRAAGCSTYHIRALED